MARTELTATQITLAGVTPTAAVAGDTTNGNVVDNDGDRLVVIVTNGGASPFTCTFVTPGNVGGFEITDKVESLAASETKWFGPFPLAVFSNQLQIDVEDAAVTLQPIRV